MLRWYPWNNTYYLGVKVITHLQVVRCVESQSRLEDEKCLSGDLEIRQKSFQQSSFCPPPYAKAGDIKTHSSVHLSVFPSVTKNFNLARIFWSIKDRALILACMILVTSPFNLHHSVTLTFDLLQGQSCCRAEDQNSRNLLVCLNVK